MRLQRSFDVVGAVAVTAVAAVVLFLPASAMGSSPIAVTNTSDSGAGSLRQAIIDANNASGSPSTIAFNIPATGSGCAAGVCTIQPTTPLPLLTVGGTIVDGATQGDTNPFGPSIVVNGSLCNCTGIVLASDGNRVNDLVVNGFTGGGSGIEIKGSNNSVTGSYVGLDATGTVAVENRFQGISVLSGTGNVIGGSSPDERNVVSGNNGQGIWLASSGNFVRGNFIGTDRTGTHAVGNGLEGVFIWPCPFAGCVGGPAQNNVVGGSTSGDRNVISGNSDGVWIQDNANLVEGNFVGTDVSGTLPVGNRHDGVHIASGIENEIGGTTAEQRNIISGNAMLGVSLPGDADRSIVEGNFIGTDVAGTAPLGNGSPGNDSDPHQGGLLVSGSSGTPSRITIGGTAAGAGNLISGNGGAQVGLLNTGTAAITVEGNLIGTDVSGMRAILNGGGVSLLANVTGAVIGGTTVAARNVMSGVFVGVGSTGTRIEGNYIGTDAAGTAALSSGIGIGLAPASADTHIGGADPGAGNLIAGGASFAGIVIGAPGTTVQGNLIGTDATGMRSLGGTGTGVVITQGGDGALIGGTTAAARNVISGSNHFGVSVDQGSTGARIEGNYIGTDAAGTAAVANQGGGVSLNGATNTVIGGSDPGSRNVISGNAFVGISVGPGSVGTSILGNYVGTDAAGSAAVPNLHDGVHVQGGATNTVIGAPGAGNVISGGDDAGVAIQGLGTIVQANRIGTDAGGTHVLGNTFGVSIAGGTTTLIGGTASDAGNVISGNGVGIVIGSGLGTIVQSNDIGVNLAGAAVPNTFAGIRVLSNGNKILTNTIAYNGANGVTVGTAVNNTISRNAIFSNGLLGIDLGGDGVTPNDPGDTDTGPNNLQNFPVLASAVVASGQLVVTGTIDTPNPQTVTLEFFANPVPVPGGDPSGYGEGVTFLGTATPAPDGTFTAVLPQVAPGTLISATATDAAGNTSEFAKDIEPLPTSADQCKNGGWQAYGVFKNQGDCVSYVTSGGKNTPAG